MTDIHALRNLGPTSHDPVRGGPSLEDSRRQHPRLETSQRCWCEGGDVTLFAQMGNLSEGGTFVKTYAPLPEGATTHLRFTLEEGPIVEARATVVWRRLAGSPTLSPGMGLRFDEMRDEHRATLRSFLEAAQGTG